MRDVVVFQPATCLLSLQFNLKTTLTVVSRCTEASVGAQTEQNTFSISEYSTATAETVLRFWIGVPDHIKSITHQKSACEEERFHSPLLSTYEYLHHC